MINLKEEMLKDAYFSHPEFYGIDTIENWEGLFNQLGDKALEKELLSKLKECDHPFCNDEAMCYKNSAGHYVFINEAYPEYWNSRVITKNDLCSTVNYTKNQINY